MPDEVFLPPDPRARLIDLCNAIANHKRWHQTWSTLRYAVSGLLTVPGEPDALASRVLDAAEELRRAVGLLSGLRNDVSYCLAAGLLRHGFEVSEFLTTFTRVRERFRAAGLPRGETEEAMACLILMEEADGEPTSAQAQAVARVFAGMRQHHRFLTGADDYPAAALLAAREETGEDMMRRLEYLYDGLHELSFKRGNQLQLATHLLYFADEPDAVLLGRFRALYSAFQEAGLWMNGGDYDEVAILSFLDVPAGEVVDRVLTDRVALRESLSPSPSKQDGFTLATNTAFLGLASQGEVGQVVLDAQQMTQALAIIAAQQAAVAATVSAAAVTAT